jgi:tetratricopeptide (TPR) repeat protein
MRSACFSVITAMLFALSACSRAPSTSSCAELDAGPPVDTPLLAFLSRARAAHHLADRAEADHDLARAVEILSAVTAGPLPGDGASLPEVREVLADTLSRLADLESQLGRFDASEHHVEQGLALVPTPTYFRGHLYEIRGLAEERRAAALTQGGDAEGAARAKTRALAALDTAMKIQAEVIEKSAPHR